MGLVLFQNEACLVINKLPGESAEFPDIDYPIFPVHRLDVPVSGCLLLGRNREAASFLGDAFSRPIDPARPGGIKKTYWAIAEKPRENELIKAADPGEVELIHWIETNRKANKSFAIPIENKNGENNKKRGLKKARLKYRIIGEGDNYLFLEIDLITGRHHQIRAQLAAQGLRIKGDLKYGARRSEKSGSPYGGGIRLHGHSLAFPNPLSPGEIIQVKTLPPYMDNLWEAFALNMG